MCHRLNQLPQMKYYKLSLYCQNISGGKSKIYQLNNYLATTLYDVICIQETWYNNSVNNSEIVSSNNYKINRCDRSTFNNKQKTRRRLIDIS